MEKQKLCRQTGHKWLEAIDVDAGGNLYFTDGAKGKCALYRHKRNMDNTLTREGEEPLLEGFDHVGGVNIDRENNDLYLGVIENKKSKILRIPLAVFDEPYQDPRTIDWLREVLNQRSFKWEFEIKPAAGRFLPSPRPNGVAFNCKTSNVYYAHEAFLFWGIFGYVGDAQNSRIWKSNSPNGLAIDNSSSEPVLVVSQFFMGRIVRLSLPDLKECQPKPHSCGFLPDGIICLENGDVLAAAPLGGKIYHLSWNGQSYGAPRTIESGLDMPTDLVIAPSSSGKGESLFVTTTNLLKMCIGAGNIFEISNIRDLIKQS